MQNILVTLPSLVFEHKAKSLPFQFPERSSTWVGYYGLVHKYYGAPGTNGLAYSSEEDESYLWGVVESTATYKKYILL